MIKKYCHSFSALPRFDSEPVGLTLFLGQTAVFECGLTASPPASVVWLKDDQPLLLDHRMKVMASGMLEISDIRLSDRGHFRCNVSNEDSSRMSRSAELKINLDTSKLPLNPSASSISYLAINAWYLVHLTCICLL